MPYIRKEDRALVQSLLTDLHYHFSARSQLTPGDLNFIISSICDSYLQAMGKNYTHINDLIGVLECAKLELYRRIAAPYEDAKIQEHGDIY